MTGTEREIRPSVAGSPQHTGTAQGVLRRARGVQLLGALEGSGYREPPALVRRADGQTLQLTPLLYTALSEIDGDRDLGGVADAVGRRIQRAVSADDVGTLVDTQLRPLGLLARADGTEPELRRTDPLLRMRFRVAVTDPAATRRITRPFTFLFTPVVVVVVLAAFAWVTGWLLFVHGLAQPTREAFADPALLFLVFVVTLLSAGFHEFGHAAATTRGGAAPGTMGVGLYLIWPAFYTDVTDSYRLGRRGRLRTDVGGLYFNAIVAVAIAAIWWFTRDGALLLVVAAQLLLMLRQLLPIVRFDGYHILADATGVPDLFQRIRPTLLALLPWRRDARAEARVLKPWARAVVTVWVLVVVPLLVASVVLLMLALPRIAATAAAAVAEQSARLGAAAETGQAGEVIARGLAIVAIALPLVGIAYLLVRLVRQLLTKAIAGTRGRPAKRVAALALAAAMLAGLAWVWWPNTGAYRPIQQNERGTVLDVVSATTAASPTAVAPLQQGETASAVALWQASGEPPTADAPQLAVVMVPANRDPSLPSWVFPFDAPDAPEPGDTQSLAVATEDGSVVYDVAFALVWADGDATNVNEAYAFASCRGCAAVAIAFQVVLVAGTADVVVPQNLSAAVTYNCVQCVTYALASQLVVTLDGPLDAATAAELDALWREIEEFARGIRDVPLAEVQARLEEYRGRVAEVLGVELPQDAPSVAPSAPGSTSSAEPSSAPSEPGESDGDGDLPATPTPSPSGSDAETADPSPAPSASPSSPAPSASPSGS
jgi:putative peptide zinc metalloprotease protein